MSIKNPEAIISLASLMLGNESTRQRGAVLAKDLADVLLPAEVVVNGATTPNSITVTGDPEPLKAGVGERRYSEVTTPAPQPAPTPAPQPAPTPAPAPAPQPVPEQPAPAMTAEELNNALVVEFRRLGGREGIDKVMADFGVSSVNDLQPAQYGELLAKVKAL